MDINELSATIETPTEKPNVALVIAETLQKKYHFLTMGDTRELFVYNPENGIYEPDADKLVESTIIKSKFRSTIRRSIIQEVIYIIKGNNYKGREEFNANEDLICVKNGVLNLSTLELIEHTPDILFTRYIPVEYNKDATCPNFEKFLRTSLEERYFNLIQEEFGFLLCNRYMPKKAFIHVGKADSGKTTLANVMINFLGGKNNVTAKSLESICERFGKTDLFGKMANICDDDPSSAVSKFGTLKTLTGESYIEGEKKGIQEKIHFWNTAKLIFTCNYIPEVDTSDETYYGRWIIIPHNKSFPHGAKNRVEGLTELITSSEEEMSGVLNFALEGYKSLKKKGEFSYSNNPLELKMIYNRYACDSVSKYVSRGLDLSNPEEFVYTEDLYLHYCRWCLINQETADVENAFARKLKSKLGENSQSQRTNKLGERKMGYKGIILRDLTH